MHNWESWRIWATTLLGSLIPSMEPRILFTTFHIVASRWLSQWTNKLKLASCTIHLYDNCSRLVEDMALSSTETELLLQKSEVTFIVKFLTYPTRCCYWDANLRSCTSTCNISWMHLLCWNTLKLKIFTKDFSFWFVTSKMKIIE